jgi:hypothetical protein
MCRPLPIKRRRLYTRSGSPPAAWASPATSAGFEVTACTSLQVQLRHEIRKLLGRNKEVFGTKSKIQRPKASSDNRVADEELKVKKATLTCEDGDGNAVYSTSSTPIFRLPVVAFPDAERVLMPCEWPLMQWSVAAHRIEPDH